MEKKPSSIGELTLPIISPSFIERRIYLIRGHKVMFDSDLAELYGVETKALNRAVRRNKDRFPDDFMFQLTKEEGERLRFQIGASSLESQYAIASSGWGGRRYLPYVFTEQGVAMLSSVLNSKRAVHVNITIMRTFSCCPNTGGKDIAYVTWTISGRDPRLNSYVAFACP
jgi:hypothetical protein